MVRDFPKSPNQSNEMALTISNSISFHCFRLMRDWKLEVLQMVRKFPPFHSERKKRSTSEGTPQFPNRISGKLPYHLTSNRDFRIFWPNGIRKHSWSHTSVGQRKNLSRPQQEWNPWRTTGVSSIHWAARTHGERSYLTEFISDRRPAYC